MTQAGLASYLQYRF